MDQGASRVQGIGVLPREMPRRAKGYPRSACRSKLGATMNIGTARPGLAFIMRALRAESWREDERGFIVSKKVVRFPDEKCWYENYLVKPERLDAIERNLETNAMPGPPVPGTDYARLLPDTDF